MLASMIGFKEVKVVYDGKDMYGRILGTIYNKGKDINLEPIDSTRASLEIRGQLAMTQFYVIETEG